VSEGEQGKQGDQGGSVGFMGGERCRGGNTAAIGARSGKARSHIGDTDVPER
jgi:hypothetical protein